MIGRSQATKHSKRRDMRMLSVTIPLPYLWQKMSQVLSSSSIELMPITKLKNTTRPSEIATPLIRSTISIQSNTGELLMPCTKLGNMKQPYKLLLMHQSYLLSRINHRPAPSTNLKSSVQKPLSKMRRFLSTIHFERCLKKSLALEYL